MASYGLTQLYALTPSCAIGFTFSFNNSCIPDNSCTWNLLIHFNIFIWFILPLSNVEDFPTLIQWFKMLTNFLSTLFTLSHSAFDTKRLLITSTLSLIYFLPWESLCFISKLTDFFHIPNPPISLITFNQSHVTVSIHSINYTSLTWQKFSNSDSKNIF